MKTRFMFCHTSVVSIPGRPEYEMSDCTVIALSNATGMPYPLAHAIAKAGGRRNGRGACMPPIIQSFCGYTGYSFEHKHLFSFVACGGDTRRRSPYPTLTQVLRTLPTTGRFILSIRRHVFAVVNGVVLDNEPTSMRNRVEHIYTITF